jgi:hypothetical protein
MQQPLYFKMSVLSTELYLSIASKEMVSKIMFKSEALLCSIS